MYDRNFWSQQKCLDNGSISDETLLNIAIVIKCIDKQSVAFAKRLFREDVEQFMIKRGFEKEANSIRLIRHWVEAEDEPGMEAFERCSRRIELRDYLLSAVSTLYTIHKGIPIVTFESLLTNIDKKILLFKLLPSNMYNVRALGTQEVEQFFSTVRDLDPFGLGTPKPDDIPSMIGAASLLDNTRMNPNRSFYMKTTRAATYPDAVFHHPVDNGMSLNDNDAKIITIRYVFTQNL